MHKYKKFCVLSLTVSLFACGEGFKTSSTATSSVATASTQVTAPQITAANENSLSLLEITYFASGSTLSFRHHSGDSVFINSILAPNPEGESSLGPYVGFVVNNGDAMNAQNISLMNTDSGVTVASTACSGQAGLECYNRIPIANTWFSSVTCPSSATVYFVPTPGNYKVQISYADGSQRSSIVVFQDPCVSKNVVQSVNGSRSIASVGDESVKRGVGIYFLTAIFFTISTVLLLVYRKSTRK